MKRKKYADINWFRNNAFPCYDEIAELIGGNGATGAIAFSSAAGAAAPPNVPLTTQPSTEAAPAPTATATTTTTAAAPPASADDHVPPTDPTADNMDVEHADDGPNIVCSLYTIHIIRHSLMLF